MSILRKLFGFFTALRASQEPLLELERAGRPMKLVYRLSEELKVNAEQIDLTRKLTLDKTRPNMGLKGTHGLFASATWWHNINSRKMPLRFVSGCVVRAYEAGQDQEGVNNTVELRCEDGSQESVGIYVNDPEDVNLFKAGAFVMVVYALDELKGGARHSGVAHSKLALEMAVSAEGTSDLRA